MGLSKRMFRQLLTAIDGVFEKDEDPHESSSFNKDFLDRVISLYRQIATVKTGKKK